MSDPTDLACVLHLHSTHSDGTGTVAEIAAAGARAGVDVVLLTDHDTLAARDEGEEGHYGQVLLLAGEEVSPRDGDHYLAFGIGRKIDHRGLTAAQIVALVEEAGGFGFAAHPFSRASKVFRRLGRPMPFSDLDAVSGIELWSFVTDTAEDLPSIRAALRFITTPNRQVDHPPAENVAGWDRLCARRRVAAVGGLDAHQIGVRIAGRVPFKIMSYRRSFAHLRTHVLAREPLTGELGRDRQLVYEPLREGRAYLAMDSLAPASGFRFWAEGADGRVEMGAEAGIGDGFDLHVLAPRPADLRLLRDGVQVAAQDEAPALAHRVSEPGVYRVEARLRAHGRARTWVLSNPVYLR